ncbi:MAG: YlbF family regulator [Acidaminococcales bacterium]|jgi:cell fate (sporulation/competence/biofilm development) regulator YlbF (YheA/YmcA/DUF963 family)|nr:YlbF family regulator [Acidaminococcales bacterium]
MNAYDLANQLARALKEGQEYSKLLAAKSVLGADGDAQKMVKDFLAKQAQLQLETLSGKEAAAGKQEQLQKLYELVVQNQKGRDYLQALMRFQLLLDDIYKILGDAVKPVLGEEKSD